MHRTSDGFLALLGAALLSAPLACGSSDGGGGPSAGAAGVSAGGGATSGGSGSAGAGGKAGSAAGGAGGTGNAGTAGQTGTAGDGPSCMPKDTGATSGPVCQDYSDASIPPDSNLGVFSYGLTQHLVPGVPYAVSLKVVGNSPMIEFWGSNSHCGPGLQKLAEQQTVVDHSYCFSLQPTSEYSEIMLVFRGPQASGSFFTDLTFCGSGSCP
ncbi:MAG: hypothetical protein ABW061_24235 [Polyangiaceae bacterium]